jgi:hypothetical protein
MVTRNFANIFHRKHNFYMPRYADYGPFHGPVELNAEVALVAFVF